MLNNHIPLKDKEFYWKANPLHVEMLDRQVGMTKSSAIKSLGDMKDADKTFRYRDLDKED